MDPAVEKNETRKKDGPAASKRSLVNMAVYSRKETSDGQQLKDDNKNKPTELQEKVEPNSLLANHTSPPIGQTLGPGLSRPPTRALTDTQVTVIKNRSKTILLALLSLTLGLLFWFWASDTNLNFYINFENVPSPVKVFTAFLGHLQTEIFYTHIGVSMRRILFSYAIAVLLGISIGMAMGRSKIVRSCVMPYIEVIRPIPAVAWIPLAILMWPTEEASIIYITFLGALFPIVLNTLHGVEQTPEVLVRASQSLGASKAAIFRHVVLPAAMPSIAAGLAIGMGVSWFSLLAGEIISGQYGIGYFTWDAYSLINYQDIVVGMLVIGFLGTLSTAGIKLITSPLLKWQKRTR